MSPRPLERGFTLVECLAVIAIVALAVSVGAVGVASSSGEARLRGARSAFLDLDARARSLAREGGGGGGRGGGATFLRIDEHRAVVERGGELLLERDLPRSVDAGMIDPSSRKPMPAVRFGADGIGPDYLIALRAADVASETLVAGLTGYAFESREVGR